MQRDEESKQEYKEMRREAKKEVAKAKNNAYDELYQELDSKVGERKFYRLARQRHQREITYNRSDWWRIKMER